MMGHLTLVSTESLRLTAEQSWAVFVSHDKEVSPNCSQHARQESSYNHCYKFDPSRDT